MKTIKKIIILITISIASHSQKGDYYSVLFSPDNEQIENENFAIVQDKQGVMFFANSKGLLKFDGKYWKLIKTPSTVLSLALDDNTGTLLIGCLDDFGFLRISKNGQENYESILKSDQSLSTYTKIIVIGDFAYVRGENELIEYQISTQKITKKHTDIPCKLDQIINFNNRILISDKTEGLFELKNGVIIRSEIKIPNGEKMIFFANNIIGTDANKLYKINKNKVEEVSTSAKKYLEQSIINDAISLNNDLIAIATNKGGCVIFNTSTLASQKTINYYSGLADDEVFAIYHDKQNGIWVAHEYGFTRIDLGMKIKNFSNYPGLTGHLESALSFQKQLYVATSEGLYYLDQVKNTAEIVQLVKRQDQIKDEKSESKEGKLNLFVRKQKDKFESIKNIFRFGKKKNTSTETPIVPKNKNEKLADTISKPKKKFLGGLFAKKEKKKIDTVSVAKVETPKEAKSQNKIIKQPEKKVFASKKSDNIGLISIDYVYKKVKNLDGKVRQLFSAKDHILAATNNGIFQIKNEKATLLNKESVSYLYVNEAATTFVACTDNKSIFIYSQESGHWKKTDQISGVTDGINSVLITKDQMIWLAGTNALYRYQRQNNIARIDTLYIKNPFSDDINLFEQNQKLYAILSEEVYELDQANLNLKVVSEIGKVKFPFKRMIYSQSNHLWLDNGLSWDLLSNNAIATNDYSYLKIIKDLQEIIVNDTKKNKAWVITKSNQLFEIDFQKEESPKNIPQVLLKSISDQDGNDLAIGNFEIDADKSFLNFQYVYPDYVDNASLKYQYKLVGWMENWSDWTSESKVPFSSLPSGDYELLVKAKNSLNQEMESKSIKFTVNPPYWQQWWFYLLEFAFFGSLLTVSIWLNRANNVNPWISRILTFITIVMLIEFLDTIIASFIEIGNSPVLSFGLQVCIALAILPFERVLSGLISDNKPLSEIISKKNLNT